MKVVTLILKRVAYAVALISAVLVLNFLLIHLAPGDPAEVIAGESGGATEEMMAEIRSAYGLDKPILEQLFIYLGKAAKGDLGQSFFYNTSVTGLILSRIWPTLLLVITALMMAMITGTLLGVLASRNPQGIASNLVTILALFGYSAPIFWTGSMLVIFLSTDTFLPLFPIAGMQNARLLGSGFWTEAVDIAHHLVLPAITLGIVYIAQYARLTRASMMEVLGADYIRTARAKGVSEIKVYTKHALRNAVLPVVTIAGLQFGTVVSGAVLIETVYSWPGLGTLAFEAILARDYPTVLGILFFSALLVIIANQITDLIYHLIDPRIKTGGD